MKMFLRVLLGLVAVLVAGLGVVYLQLTGGLSRVEAAVEVGQTMPEFKLPSVTDGKEAVLSSHKGKDIVVVVFVNQGCPFSLGAEPAISAVAEKYKGKGVVFYGIDSNKTNTPESVKEHVTKAKVPFAVLKDAGNVYADAVGAKVTPEIFVVAKDGNIAYHGAPDDRTKPDGVPGKTYLEDALAALTSDKAVEVKEAKAWGCGIKR